ncbi:MAG: hypothetical protein ACP5D2_04790, partial [Candidatus Nanoarchaeia archaeon]
RERVSELEASCDFFNRKLGVPDETDRDYLEDYRNKVDELETAYINYLSHVEAFCKRGKTRLFKYDLNEDELKAKLSYEEAKEVLMRADPSDVIVMHCANCNAQVDVFTEAETLDEC